MTFLPRHKISELIDLMDIDRMLLFDAPYYVTNILLSENENDRMLLDKDLNRSTLFPLEDDIVFIEFRGFGGILGHFLKLSSTMDLLKLRQALNPGKERDVSDLLRLVDAPEKKKRKTTRIISSE